MSPTLKPLIVVAGLGTGAGTGGAAARLFASKGYAVALIARQSDALENLAKEITATGAQAKAFPISAYTHASITEVWGSIHSAFPSAEYSVLAAVYNAAHGIWKPFLSITAEDVKATTDTDIDASFAFARGALLAFQNNELADAKSQFLGEGTKGALIFTGATASLRGNVTTSAFSAGRFALRSLSQSLAKEFGPQNIHVSHAVIDGGILTGQSRSRRNDPEWEKDPNQRLTPEGIAKSYWYLAQQDRSNWTWELDLRPAHEKW